MRGVIVPLPSPAADLPRPVMTGRVDEVTCRVLAPNPSPMTLDGTNTYLVGAPGSGEAVVVDPGPDLARHRSAVERVAAAADARIAAVVVTHHHADHAAAAGWADGWQVPLWAFAPDLVPGARPLPDGRRLPLAGLHLDAIHTPGHSGDHLCLRIVETGAVLAGDHVLGRGTTVLAWPDGDVTAYLRSLDRLARLRATRLDPGHGPSLADPAATIAAYRDHRGERERQIVDAVAAGAATSAEIVARVYSDVDPALHPAAERSVLAHVAKLVDEGRVEADGPLTSPHPRLRAAAPPGFLHDDG